MTDKVWGAERIAGRDDGSGKDSSFIFGEDLTVGHRGTTLRFET